MKRAAIFVFIPHPSAFIPTLVQGVGFEPT